MALPDFFINVFLELIGEPRIQRASDRDRKESLAGYQLF